MPSGQAQPVPQQQQKQVRKPPLADWPTIKILTPPQGQFSLQRDEWCMTYCSQSITGRINGKEPSCRSMCIRKVFPHEVRNLVAFKKHKELDQSGKAPYPLPAEGQAANLPRILGGKPPEDTDNPNYKPQPHEPPKTWDEGWYFWTGKGRLAAHEKMDSMLLDLDRQRRMASMREKRKEVWQDYQDSLRQQTSAQNDGENVRLWVPNIPLRPLPDTGSKSLLVPLPPNFPPFWERVNNLLTPSVRVLGILYNSFKSGEHEQFALRVWEKAWTNEPFMLASRACSRAYELWKEKVETTDEENDKKNPP